MKSHIQYSGIRSPFENLHGPDIAARKINRMTADKMLKPSKCMLSIIEIFTDIRGKHTMQSDRTTIFGVYFHLSKQIGGCSTGPSITYIQYTIIDFNEVDMRILHLP